MERFLNEVLGTHLKFWNPYVDKTKAEVIQHLYERLPAAIPISSSCWKMPD
jgi:hypothetical protein